MPRKDQDGFSLIELLVVVIIIGILAAIGIPRILSQQERARNTVAVSDLRNLIVVEIGLEASSGLSDDPAVIADQGWVGTDDQIRLCAELSSVGDDITLTAWHRSGNLVYTYRRSVATITSNEIPLEETCAAQVGPSATTMWPHP